jgi:hypothetical protein
MPFHRGKSILIPALFSLALLSTAATAQTGNAGSIRGTVTDPSGAVIPGATVHLANSVSGLDRTATTDAAGLFSIPNVAFNSYKLSVFANGFAQLDQNVEMRSAVGINLKLVLQIFANASSFTV